MPPLGRSSVFLFVNHMGHSFSCVYEWRRLPKLKQHTPLPRSGRLSRCPRGLSSFPRAPLPRAFWLCIAVAKQRSTFSRRVTVVRHPGSTLIPSSCLASGRLFIRPSASAYPYLRHPHPCSPSHTAPGTSPVALLSLSPLPIPGPIAPLRPSPANIPHAIPAHPVTCDL